MADIVDIANIGGVETTRNMCPATGPSAQVAGATAAITSVTIDRLSFNAASLPRSMVLSTQFYTTLAAGKTLSFALEIDSSPDGTTWTPLATQTAAVTGAVATGAGTSTGCVDFSVDLRPAARFVRAIVTPVLSATSVDTVNVVPVGIFAGFDRINSNT